jgi:hypothetical protein
MYMMQDCIWILLWGADPNSKQSHLHNKDKINYSGSVSLMYKLLRNIGFHRKTNDHQKFLLKMGDIITALVKFSRTMHSLRFRSDECPRPYLAETSVN